MDDYMSEFIDDVLSFLDSIKEQVAVSEVNLEEANLDLQDIQHFIEFGKADGKVMSRVYKIYKKTRRKRRNAKEKLELCAPILEWYKKNSKAVQELREVLGKVRKIEQQQANRAYAIRGHILDEIRNETHLSGRGLG